ncbi:MAG TPA: hypothetical protein VF070_17900 [Streptosporangiaceae bacterium]
MLVARNAFLFSARLYEQGDSGANSILIEQALRFRLLVGNYSREGFNHPGPAYMYIQAFGEWVAYHLLHVVSTPWNGQLLAALALDSAFAALAVGIVYGWTRSVRAAVAAFVVILGFAALHPPIFASNWMPYLYVMPFFVFLLAAASVAARQAQDLWVLALSGWLLIHGHVCFLLIVPLITVAAAAIAMWPDRRRLLAAVRIFIGNYRGSWIPAMVISAVFVFPIVLNVILHWPGDFGKYFAYSGSGKAGGHPVAQVARYALWYWWPHGSVVALVVLVLLFAAALAAAVAFSRGRLRRCLLAVVAMAVAASFAFAIYAAVGIDDLDAAYIGYFYWSAPCVLLLVVVVALAARASASLATTALALAGAAGALIASAFLVNLRINMHDNDPELPGAVATLAARGHGRLIVIEPQDIAWPEVNGFLMQAERTGVRVCVNQPASTYSLTSQFVCSARQVAAGVHYEFLASTLRNPRVILRYGTAGEGYATVIADGPAVA